MKRRKRLSILLVEDDHVLREMIAEVLEFSGFEVAQARDGMEGFRLFLLGRFDAVLTDVQMKGGDGVALLKAIVEHRPEIPVFLMTGNPKLDLGTCRSAYAVFRKPFDIAVMVQEIRDAVARGLLRIPGPRTRAEWLRLRGIRQMLSLRFPRADEPRISIRETLQEKARKP